MAEEVKVNRAGAAAAERAYAEEVHLWETKAAAADEEVRGVKNELQMALTSLQDEQDQMELLKSHNHHVQAQLLAAQVRTFDHTSEIQQ